MSVLRYLLEKEFKQFLRNRFLPRMALMYPLVVLLIMPLATTMDIKDVSISVVDKDCTILSKQLIEKMDASNYFTIYTVERTYAAALEQVENGQSDIIVEIPHFFSTNIDKKQPTSVQISANAVNGMKGSLGASYLRELLHDFSQQIYPSQFELEQVGPTVSSLYLYNNTLNYRYFMIPGLMVFVIILLAGFLPALNIVSEKEIGTIEQINVTPVKKSQFILAKLIPYWLIGVVALTICFTVGWLVYDLAPVGHLMDLYLLSLLFIFIMSGIGLIISNYSKTMQQATFVMFFFMLLFVLMSGLFTPVSSMPTWARVVAAFIPPHYFVDAMRSIYLKGSTLFDLSREVMALVVFSVLINLWAVKSYNKVE